MSRSSSEAETFIQHLFRAPLSHDDNEGTVCWSVSEATTKNLRLPNSREVVAVRDNIRHAGIFIEHIPGDFNFADVFTKERRQRMSCTFTICEMPL